VLRTISCLGKHDQLHRRKFPGQRVPISHRKHEAVISGNHQDGRRGDFQFFARMVLVWKEIFTGFFLE
jgi:hypothetical protein